ncbi:MAG: hypothetical protein AB9872_02505 [Solidesulfovibrio sp.]
MVNWLKQEEERMALTYCNIISGFLKFTKRYKDTERQYVLNRRSELSKYYWGNMSFDDAYLYEFKEMREHILLFFEQEHFVNYYYLFIDAWNQKYDTSPTIDEIAKNFPDWIQSHIKERYEYVNKAKHLLYPIRRGNRRLVTTIPFHHDDVKLLERLLQTLEMKENRLKNRDISKVTYPDKEYNETTRRLVQRDYKSALDCVEYIEVNGLFFLEETP